MKTHVPQIPELYVGGNEPCKADNIRYMHNDFWSCEAQSFVRIPELDDLNQYAFWRSVTDPGDLEELRRWHHLDDLQAIARSINPNSILTRIAIGTVDCYTDSNRKLAESKGLFWSESKGINRIYTLFVHDIDDQLTENDLYGNNMPTFGGYSELGLISTGEKMDSQQILDVLNLPLWPQKGQIRIDLITKEFFIWVIENGYTLIMFRSDVYNVKWPVIYTKAENGKQVRLYLESRGAWNEHIFKRIAGELL